MTVAILVEPETDEVSCTYCGERIPISRKKQENWVYCLNCDEPLVLNDAATGRALNQTWAALASDLEKRMAQTFDVARFPSEAMARSWKNFEKKYPRDVIEDAIRICREGYARRGQRCWPDVMAYVKARKQGVDPDGVTPSDSGGIAL